MESRIDSDYKKCGLSFVILKCPCELSLWQCLSYNRLLHPAGVIFISNKLMPQLFFNKKTSLYISLKSSPRVYFRPMWVLSVFLSDKSRSDVPNLFSACPQIVPWNRWVLCEKGCQIDRREVTILERNKQWKLWIFHSRKPRVLWELILQSLGWDYYCHKLGKITTD